MTDRFYWWGQPDENFESSCNFEIRLTPKIYQQFITDMVISWIEHCEYHQITLHFAKFFNQCKLYLSNFIWSHSRDDHEFATWLNEGEDFLLDTISENFPK